jgi:hypothetical protein
MIKKFIHWLNEFADSFEVEIVLIQNMHNTLFQLGK